MNRFLQLHVLTSYPPSNLNRDDLGRPKSAVMGGRNRLRISSQCLKRAWRTSELFEKALDGHIGLRTKQIGLQSREKLKERGVDAERAAELGRSIAEFFGKVSSTSDAGEFHNETVAHITPEEQKAIDDLIEELAGGAELEAKSKDVLSRENSAVDVAMFGRMLASTPQFNVEAAVQVAHALTTHAALIQDDFFTAVDDLSHRDDEDRGSAHMGETEFGAGVFYLYVCVDRAQLVENLGGDRELAARGIQALIEAVCTVAPSGKQNSFGSRAYAEYALAELGDRQPRSLSTAFVDPVGNGDQMRLSIKELENRRDHFDRAYGACADDHYPMNVPAGEGRLTELLAFATRGMADA